MLYAPLAYGQRFGLSGIWLACSTKEEKLRETLLEARTGTDASTLNTTLSSVQKEAVNSVSTAKADLLFAKFVKNGTWQVPTLVVSWVIAFPNIRSVGINPIVVRVPAARSRLAIAEPCSGDPTANEITLSGAGIDTAYDMIAAMRRGGVEFMAGTDAPNLWFGPGSSLHDELELLVQAGFTPMEALQSATLGPARYLGLDQSLGTVEAGKIADLVLLDANPLEEIGNTRMISAVVLRGRLIRKSEL